MRGKNMAKNEEEVKKVIEYANNNNINIIFLTRYQIANILHKCGLKNLKRALAPFRM